MPSPFLYAHEHAFLLCDTDDILILEAVEVCLSDADVFVA